MKVAVIGAGSAQFLWELADLCALHDVGPYEIALCDTHPVRLSTVEAFAHRVIDIMGTPTTVSATGDRRVALADANAVVVSVGVGMQDSIRPDFEIPARYGLRQTVADTCGIGAVIRILRTAPVMARIASDVVAANPDAWLLNVTNPMAMICMALDRMVPAARTVGLCHSTWITAAEIAGHLGVPSDELTFDGSGVNHQVFISRLEHQGRDLYPEFRRMADDPEHPIFDTVRGDLMRRFGLYVTESSKHNSEYVPWYLPHDSEVKRYGLEPNPYWERRSGNAEWFAMATDFANGRSDLPIADMLPSGEYAPQIIRSLVTGEERSIYVNVPNRDGAGARWIDELPEWGVVEVPATCDAGGVNPRRAGPVPPQCAAINRRYLDVCDLAVRAVVDGSREHVFHAAYLDANASATMTLDAIHAMVDELLDAHQAAGRLPESLHR